MPEGEAPGFVAAGVFGRDVDARIECFRLGARIHDHVSDMLEAIQEIDESKEGQALGPVARAWLTELARLVEGEGARAQQIDCLDPDTEEMILAVVRQSRAGDETALREDAYDLAVKLGDPPVLRNIRRYEQLGSRPATETKR